MRFPQLMRLFPVLLCVLCNMAVHAHSHRDSLAGNEITFIENKGQWEPGVLFRAEVNSGSVYLERDGFTFDVRDQEAFGRFTGYKTLDREVREKTLVPDGLIGHFAWRVKFLGCNTNAAISANNPLPGIYNYFLGNDPSKWASSVQRYTEVSYQNIYKGIDLHVKRDDVLFKYEFHCSPGSDPGVIALKYDEVAELKLRYGNLFIQTPFGSVIVLKPVAYQMINGRKVDVPCRFRLKNQVISYDLGKYDKAYPLVIDPPVRIFASYTGSTADNWGYTATYDALGHLYAGGNTFGVGYPVTSGAYQVNYAGHSSDIVITKFDTTGASLVYSTYLGGSGTEVPHSLVVNSQGQLFMLGSTGSANFPVTPFAYDQTFNGGTAYTLTAILNYTSGSDIVVAKLSADGTQLLASTYVGGSANDGLNTASILKYNYADEVRGEVLLDHAGNVLVVSSTYSTNFPVTPGAYQTTPGGGQDAVVFKMDNQLSSMIWSTYLGGSGNDAGYSIETDNQFNVYLGGGTTSTNFPVTPGVVQPVYGGGTSDGWMAKIGPAGNQLLLSTYLGKVGYDQVYFIDRDRWGSLYAFGQTSITGTLWVQNAAWFQPGGGHFICKLDANLSQFVWSTVFGPSGTVGPKISPTAFMVDLCNRVYLSGWGGQINSFGGTNGMPITPDAFQLTTDNSDYYFMIMQDDASSLLYGTFYGGASSNEHVDGGTSRFDNKGRIYQAVCAGCGGHSDFPTSPGAWSAQNKSTNCNMGVVVFDFLTPALVADFLDPPAICAPDTIAFINISQIPNPSNTTALWDFGDGTTSTSMVPIKIYTQPGIYNVTLILSDMGSCNFADTITKQIVVLSGSSSPLNPVEVCLGGSSQIGILPISHPGVTYLWSPSAGLNNPNISNPIASPSVTTNYKLFVSNGVCTDTFNQQFVVYDLQVDAGPDVAVCQGAVVLTATTANTNVSFQWSDNPAFTTTLNASPNDPSCTVTLGVPQYYYVKIYNSICSAYDSVYLDQQVKFASVNPVDPNCHNVCDGTASVTMATGTPPFQYQWSGSSSTTNQAVALCAGVHTVTVTDANGCYGVAQFTLIDPPLLISNAYAHMTPCADVCLGRGYANPSGGTPPYSYQWNDPMSQQSNPATNLCPGTYHVTITDSRGCVTNDQVLVEDSAIYVQVAITAARDTLYEGQSVQLVATWLGNGYSYKWTPTKWLNNPNIFNPIATPYGTVVYKVTVQDIYGCTWTDSILLTVLEVFCEETFIFVPNAFTPNGDGVNDILYLYTLYADDVYLAIFNRWGEKVFETKNRTVGWDGTYKGREVDPGVFDYYLEVRCYNQKVFKKKGNITLIR